MRAAAYSIAARYAHATDACVFAHPLQQFEKHAGLGHRKKWKESVRYAERRVVDYLKDRSAALGGEALVGSLLWVCWLRERAFYLGVVRSWDAKEGAL